MEFGVCGKHNKNNVLFTDITLDVKTDRQRQTDTVKQTERQTDKQERACWI